jgi:uncharacterized protein YqfA (UPF0365 family)
MAKKKVHIQGAVNGTFYDVVNVDVENLRVQDDIGIILGIGRDYY